MTKEQIIYEMVQHFYEDGSGHSTCVDKKKASLIKKHCSYLKVTKDNTWKDRPYRVEPKKGRKPPKDHIIIYYKEIVTRQEQELDRYYYGIQKLYNGEVL